MIVYCKEPEIQNKNEKECKGGFSGWASLVFITSQMNHNHCHLTETTHMLRLTFLHCQMV